MMLQSLQFLSVPSKIELISDTNAQLIQNSITSYRKNQERTRKKRERKKRKIIDHMTERKRRQNRVAAFLCKAEWINETAPKCTSENNILNNKAHWAF